MGGGYQLDEVVVADLVLSQEDQVVRTGRPTVRAPSLVVVDHVGLATQDRLHPLPLARPIEGQGGVHDPVVGQGQCRHPKRPGLGSKILDVGQTVEE